MSIIRLFLVEDQPLILKNQFRLLAQFSDLEILGAAQSGEEAVRSIADLAIKPDVVLCDIGLIGMSGIEVARHIKTTWNINVLLFTVFKEEDLVQRAVKAGAAGYLLKGASSEEIYHAILEVFRGGSVIEPALVKHLLSTFLTQAAEIERNNSRNMPLAEPVPELTLRELECLQIVAKGLSNQEAAQVLKLSTATIRTHLEHIYFKLDVTNRVEAITEGIRHGIIEL